MTCWQHDGRVQVSTELLAPKNATGKVADSRRFCIIPDSSHIRHSSSHTRRFALIDHLACTTFHFHDSRHVLSNAWSIH